MPQQLRYAHRLRDGVILILSLLPGVIAGGCADVSRPLPVTVPAAVQREISGRSVGSAATVPVGPAKAGVGIVGDTEVRPPATLEVVTWLSSDSSRAVTVRSDKSWTAVDVVVEDQEGAVVFDEAEQKALLRGGGPATFELGKGRSFVRTVSFRVNNPGTYRVFGRVSIRVGDGSGTGTTTLSRTTDPLTLTVR